MRKFGNEFEMSPWTSGQADWILNMNIARDWEKGTLHLSQPKAIEKLAERFGLDDGNRKPYVPMSPLLKLNKPSDDAVVSSSVFDYPSAVGGLLYLSLTARPDVAQSVSVLSRFMSCPGHEHVDAAKQLRSTASRTPKAKADHLILSPLTGLHCKRSFTRARVQLQSMTQLKTVVLWARTAMLISRATRGRESPHQDTAC